MSTVNSVVAFLLEIAVLVGVCLWGFHLQQGLPIRILAGVGAPVLMAVAWGIFGSPKAPVGLPGPLDAAFRILWFGVGALAFWAADRWVAGLALIGVYAVNAAMLGSL